MDTQSQHMGTASLICVQQPWLLMTRQAELLFSYLFLFSALRCISALCLALLFLLLACLFLQHPAMLLGTRPRSSKFNTSTTQNMGIYSICSTLARFQQMWTQASPLCLPAKHRITGCKCYANIIAVRHHTRFRQIQHAHTPIAFIEHHNTPPCIPSCQEKQSDFCCWRDHLRFPCLKASCGFATIVVHQQCRRQLVLPVH